MTDAAALIKQFEGCRLKSYQDSVGVWTCGYGHTGSDVKPGMQISLNQADDWLYDDIKIAQGRIIQYITTPINDNQLAALTSLVFNLGTAPLKGTLGHMLNQGDYAGAASQFSLWVHAGGKILQGLVTRRAAEKKLFLTPSPELKITDLVTPQEPPTDGA